jgi:hypothetical protein
VGIKKKMEQEMTKIRDRLKELQDFLIKYTLNDEDLVFIEQELADFESNLNKKEQTDEEEIN